MPSWPITRGNINLLFTKTTTGLTQMKMQIEGNCMMWDDTGAEMIENKVLCRQLYTYKQFISS